MTFRMDGFCKTAAIVVRITPAAHTQLAHSGCTKKDNLIDCSNCNNQSDLCHVTKIGRKVNVCHVFYLLDTALEHESGGFLVGILIFL